MIIIVFILLVAFIYAWRYFENERADRISSHHKKRENEFNELLETLKDKTKENI